MRFVCFDPYSIMEWERALGEVEPRGPVVSLVHGLTKKAADKWGY